MNNPPSDLGIPILTEVIAPDAADHPLPPARRDPAPPLRTEFSAPTPPARNTLPPPAAAIPAARMQVPPAFPAAPVPTTVTPARPQAAAQPDTVVPAAGAKSAEEWEQLEIELRQNITRQVLGRINFVLDHRVRNSLTDVVDAAIDGLAVEIKRSLHDTLEEIVARAIAQEISRLQTLKK